MATTQENAGELRDVKPLKEQSNSDNSKAVSDQRNVDNGENQISNATQSRLAQPGIAKVGNTGAENE